ncbi:MAG: amidohydrolase family protein [Planctomycetota bacterium]
MRRILTLLATASSLFAQAPQQNGPREVDPGWHAIVAETIHVGPGKTVRGTILIKDGRIVSVTAKKPPAGARVWEADTVHAGFIDAYVPTEGDPFRQTHWNKKVHPDRRTTTLDGKAARELRQLGFTAAVAAPKSGIFRGRASLLSLAPKEQALYREGVYQACAFERYRSSKDGFPTAQMGAIAVLRQGLIDGLANDERLAFVTDDELEALRAFEIYDAIDRAALIIGSGRELRRIEAIAAMETPVILPLDFPEAPDVTSIDKRMRADLRALLFWEHAPFNPRFLVESGIPVALTTARLEKRSEFMANLRRARKAGLSDDDALAALTTIPASLLGVSKEMGMVEPGMRANLTVLDGKLFEKKARVRSVWIDGVRTEIRAPKRVDWQGFWRVQLLPRFTFVMGIDFDEGNRLRIFDKSEKTPSSVRIVDNRISFVWEGHTFSATRLEGVEKLHGHGVTKDGRNFIWTAVRKDPPKPKEKKVEPAKTPELPKLRVPYGPYGFETRPPTPERILLRGATIWTCGPQGIVENGDILIENNRIAYVGPRKEHGNAVAIDLTGKHVTPGIIDCHSHTGISKGVNDSGQQCTAEVRIGDVTNPDHISWYRQLACGVTTVNSLHGSANPIGGQSQTNKVRWGVASPKQMHFVEAQPGIKFALGENVKQSNWGDDFKTRYPQTRMGVEAYIRDRFTAAREYAKGHTRRDLELEALAEVLAGKRLVHCHSYRQDEILMLARIAQEFGFRIGTYQHVLEGYKVAEAIRAHAIGASAFSDWWAFKVEVQDAIPYNGPLMHRAGVLVSFNSDSDDLVRRLNVEAAKAIKYGGLDPEEALKFVTINPATQLGVQRWVGSLEAGKHADIAVWSGPPLSVYSRCERTFIDGIELYSLKKDEQHRAWIASERVRLVAKALKSPRKPGGGRASNEEPTYWDCGQCGFAGSFRGAR